MRTLTTQNGSLHQQITQRQQQIGETSNVAWLEEQARRLGFVYPGETIFIITTPGSPLPPSGGVNAVLPSFAPPSPSPIASASPGASPSSSAGATPSPRPSPTPLVFVMPSPTPH